MAFCASESDLATSWLGLSAARTGLGARSATAELMSAAAKAARTIDFISLLPRSVGGRASETEPFRRKRIPRPPGLPHPHCIGRILVRRFCVSKCDAAARHIALQRETPYKGTAAIILSQ